MNPVPDTEAAELPFDPEAFDATLEPAVVHLQSGDQALIAHHEPAPGGWLYLVGWAGCRVAVPPHRVAFIDVVETETVGELGMEQRIVDDEIRREATAAVENGHPDLAEGLSRIDFDGGERCR